MSLVPTAAAQLAPWAEPARWTHCQGRQGLMQTGWDTAARAPRHRGLQLPPALGTESQKGLGWKELSKVI